jgi:AcrR family transcriptional regulator
VTRQDPDLADPQIGEATGDGEALSHNLVGQRLGRKGRDTRVRILAAASKLLADTGGPSITLTAVAREASLGMTSLYLYFRDLSELLAAILDPILASIEDAYLSRLREPWPDEVLGERCRDFVGAYYVFWRRHSRPLHLRNTFSDNGDERMLRMRHGSSRPMLDLLVAQMEGDTEDVNSDAFHMATALLTGLERMATMATDPNFPTLSTLTGPPRPGHDPAVQAHGLEVSSARLLELAIRDGRARARTGG